MTTENRKPNIAQLATQHDEERHLMDYVRILYKRRWIAIPAFLIVFAVGTINSYRKVAIYEARTQIMIEKDTPKVGTLETMFQQQDAWYNDDFYRTQYRILQSRSLAHHTAELMHLKDRMAAQTSASAGDDGFSVSGAIAWAKKQVVGEDAQETKKAEDEAKVAAALAKQDPLAPYASMVLGSLMVSPIANSRLVDLKFTSTDPQLAADMANAHAKAYIQQNLEYKFAASKDATDWLSERLAEQRKKVEESEAALQKYKEEHDAVAVEDRQNIVVQRLGDLNSAVTKAKTARIEKEAQYNQLKSIQGTPSVESFPAVVANDYIQKLKSELGDLQRQQAQLSEKYGDRHPEMIKIRSAVQSTQAKLDLEVSKVVQSVEAEYQAALAQERSLVGALDSQKGEALSLNRKGIEYSVLNREAESNRQVYEALLQRTKETGISGELKASNIRVVDSAEVPNGPILPQRRRDLLMAGFSGLGLSIGLVFGFEYLDNRIKSPHELRANLNLPYLGMIPAIDKTGPMLVSGAVPPGFAEAIRAVRTNVLFSSADEGIRRIVVTSAGPNEGKGMFASNLAVSLAQAGQRTLHVDADMRRPRVHEI